MGQYILDNQFENHSYFSPTWHTRLSDGDNQGQGEPSQLFDDDRNSAAKKQESHLTQTEGCKDWDFLVGRRRYLLPGHYTTFMADLGANAEAAGRQRENAYV